MCIVCEIKFEYCNSTITGRHTSVEWTDVDLLKVSEVTLVIDLAKLHTLLSIFVKFHNSIQN